MTTTNRANTKITDEEIQFYGDQYQDSKEKKNNIPFQVYLEQELQKKYKGVS